MPRIIYCWRCNMDIPMLTDKLYRETTGCSLAEASPTVNGRRQPSRRIRGGITTARTCLPSMNRSHESGQKSAHFGLPLRHLQ